MNILVTGVTGTLGLGLIDKLHKYSHIDNIIGFSRDELKQSFITQNSRIKLILGDLRDEKKTIDITKGIDLIFHCAALKRIDTLEDNPYEAVKTNIIGTYNLCNAQKINNVKKMVFTSTDKACYPVNVYGATKMIAERLVLENPNNVVTRWGNVMGSRGSLIPGVYKRLIQNIDIELTNELMERYWIKIQDAIGFLIKVGMMNYSGVQIPVEYMKKARVKTIIEILKDLTKSSSKIINTKCRRGEKILEDMITTEDKMINYSEVQSIQHYTDNDLAVELLKLVNSYKEKGVPTNYE